MEPDPAGQGGQRRVQPDLQVVGGHRADVSEFRDQAGVVDRAPDRGPRAQLGMLPGGPGQLHRLGHQVLLGLPGHELDDLALLIGVPVAVAGAIYATELCPLRLRAPLTILVELLAAVPSVVYGLWGIFFLAPKLQPAEQWVAEKLSFIPFIGGRVVTIPNYFITGLVLAIMILPIVSAISREVMSTVPPDHKEAALGLGATRWEMIRVAVLPYCRSGIVGGAMLGLGRAIGETIAVTILIGDAPQLGSHLFGQGYSLAAVIANEFGEAQGLHRSALFAAGLVLFVLTLLVNILARWFVRRGTRGTRAPEAEPAGATGGVVSAASSAGAN